MKIPYVIGCTLLLSVLGCKQESPPAQPAPGVSQTVSNGGYTWTLGATTINGTNVPSSNVTVRTVTNLPSK
jgi:hypothetical protein